MRLTIAVLLSGVGLAAQTTPVTIPRGRTRLGDIGRYRVAYQSYGRDIVDMPACWVGHFDEATGVSYVPSEQMLGRHAILLHSPWRTAPGRAFVEYRVTLPEAAPITLGFGIAMKPGTVGPKHGDGVTFSCTIEDENGARELMRQHQTEAEWQDYEFDLTALGGQTVTLRLQVDPGPDNSPSFDFSYFGNARFEAGTAPQGERELLRDALASQAYRATCEIPLDRVANRPGNGVVPSNLLPFTNRVKRTAAGWQLIYEGADCRIVYTYMPRTGTFDDIVVQVDDGAPFRPAGGGAIVFADAPDVQLVTTAEAGNRVETTVRRTGGRAGGDARFLLGIEGKALVIDIESVDATVEQIRLGGVGGAALRRRLAVPYYSGRVDCLPAQRLFVNRQFDWTRTYASVCHQDTASYHERTDGTRTKAMERAYIAVSPSIHEVFPNLPDPPSPYLEQLGDKIMLDIWGHHHDGTFQGDAITLRRLKDNGVDHMAIIQHVWQRYGYDVKLPDHIPAHPDMGGDEGMAEFGRTANELGYLWSVHENYIDLYPDAPSYDPAARVLRSDGTPSPAWFNTGTGVQSYGLKCNRALGYAKQNAPEIHRRYATTAAYLDVHTCVPPWHQLDHEAGQPFAAMCRGKVERDRELFRYMRDTHGGALFGEGNNHFYWAGACDGVEAQVNGGEDHRPLLDFDLLKIHPQMVNHGMGYYERWFRRGYSHAPGLDSCAPFQIDKYRAQELAYGHAGFIGNLATANVQWIAKEHNLMHPVQRLYGAAKATRIDYEVDGHFVTASIALALNRVERQRITYSSGLTLWVNWGDSQWTVEGRTLPQWGFLALGPDTEVWTALAGDAVADYARCPEFVFVDARTHFHMPYRRGAADVTPSLKAIRSLGPRKVELTFEWDVGEPLERDYTCFAHVLSELSEKDDLIVAQTDHDLPTPPTEWRPGQRLIDGPFTVDLPGEGHHFELVIGLYDRRGRCRMKGVDRDDRRYLIGVLEVTDDGVVLGDFEQGAAKYRSAIEPADFTRNMNPVGTRIDAGIVATDGSVKIARGTDRLTVFPYPRGRSFTVELDPRALGLGTDRCTVTALKTLGDEPLQTVPATRSNGRLSFRVGREGAGRYIVSPIRR